MKTARIDVAKADGEGLVLGASVSITLTGTIKGLDTYDMTEMPLTTSDDKKEKKEPPKVTINLEIAKTELSKGPGKTPKQAFNEEYDKGKKKEE